MLVRSQLLPSRVSGFSTPRPAAPQPPASLGPARRRSPQTRDRESAPHSRAHAGSLSAPSAERPSGLTSPGPASPGSVVDATELQQLPPQATGEWPRLLPTAGPRVRGTAGGRRASRRRLRQATWTTARGAPLASRRSRPSPRGPAALPALRGSPPLRLRPSPGGSHSNRQRPASFGPANGRRGRLGGATVGARPPRSRAGVAECPAEGTVEHVVLRCSGTCPQPPNWSFFPVLLCLLQTLKGEAIKIVQKQLSGEGVAQAPLKVRSPKQAPPDGKARFGLGNEHPERHMRDD